MENIIANMIQRTDYKSVRQEGFCNVWKKDDKGLILIMDSEYEPEKMQPEIFKGSNPQNKFEGKW